MKLYLDPNSTGGGGGVTTFDPDLMARLQAAEQARSILMHKMADNPGGPWDRGIDALARQPGLAGFFGGMINTPHAQDSRQMGAYDSDVSALTRIQEAQTRNLANQTGQTELGMKQLGAGEGMQNLLNSYGVANPGWQRTPAEDQRVLGALRGGQTPTFNNWSPSPVVGTSSDQLLNSLKLYQGGPDGSPAAPQPADQPWLQPQILKPLVREPIRYERFGPGGGVVGLGEWGGGVKTTFNSPTSANRNVAGLADFQQKHPELSDQEAEDQFNELQSHGPKGGGGGAKAGKQWDFSKVPLDALTDRAGVAKDADEWVALQNELASRAANPQAQSASPTGPFRVGNFTITPGSGGTTNKPGVQNLAGAIQLAQGGSAAPGAGNAAPGGAFTATGGIPGSLTATNQVGGAPGSPAAAPSWLAQAGNAIGNTPVGQLFGAFGRNILGGGTAAGPTRSSIAAQKLTLQGQINDFKRRQAAALPGNRPAFDELIGLRQAALNQLP